MPHLAMQAVSTGAFLCDQASEQGKPGAGFVDLWSQTKISPQIVRSAC